MTIDADAFFYAQGLLATDLLEVSHDPADLDRPGFWAVVGTFEGAWTLARFGRIRQGQPQRLKAIGSRFRMTNGAHRLNDLIINWPSNSSGKK